MVCKTKKENSSKTKKNNADNKVRMKMVKTNKENV